jgi:uncharacterized protein (DUF885 family)
LDQAYHDIVADYFRGYFAFHPTWATFTGVHDHDGRLEDWGEASIAGEGSRLRSILDRLARVDLADLPTVDRHDHAILTSAIEAEILSLEVLRPFETNPIEYNNIISFSLDELILKEFAPRQERLARIVERLREIPRFLGQARENLKNPAAVITEQAIELVGGTLTFLRESLPAAFPDAAGPDLERAVREVEGFLAFLKEDLLPRSTGEYAIGESMFLKRLRLEVMTDHPLETIKALGEENLRRTREAFLETAAEIDPEGDPRRAMESIRDDHPSAEDLISTCRDRLEGIRQFLVLRDIVTLPSEERCRVIPQPPFMWGFAAMNPAGPLEEVAKDAYFYVDPVEDDWTEEKKTEHLRAFNRPVMEVISIHEAYPGHYVQCLYQRDAPSLVRKVFWSYAYGEGWAHYAEQMMMEEGFGEGDPRTRLAQLEEALLRLCRYRVAIGLHTERWTVEKGQRFFEEEGFIDAYSARREAVRGTFDPLYLCYTLGKMQFLKLRDDYREATGEAFRLRDFHDRCLAAGSVPLSILRKELLGEDCGPDL